MLSNEVILQMFDRRDMEILNSQGGVQGFATNLGVNLDIGIDDREKEDGYWDRINKYGQNILPDPPTKSWCEMFGDAYQDLMIKILLIAALFSLILTILVNHDHFQEYIEPLSIFLAVLIVSTVQAHTNYSQQKAFLEINKLKNSYDVNVIRGGKEIQIKSTEVLKGDILSLKSGDAVSADCIYFMGQDLKVNNSSQTGESVPISISEKDPFIYAGSAIETGFGRALVVSIGQYTRSGEMMIKIQDIEQESEKSPLEQKLDIIAVNLTWIGAFGATLTFIVLFIFWVIDYRENSSIPNALTFYLNKLVDKVMTAITIFICAVPEGVPLAVTLTLGFSMNKMMDDQSFVRHLSSCETMGGATTICSDKTGTLTQNKMTVTAFYQIGSTPCENMNTINQNVIDIISNSIANNSTAFETTKTKTMIIDDIVQSYSYQEYVGSSSECALLQLLSDWKKDYRSIRENSRKLYVHEFNSERKRMSTLVQEENNIRLYFKGGSDFSLPYCSHYMDERGDIHELTQERIVELRNQISSFASDSLRTMIIGYRDFRGEEFNEDMKIAGNVENNIVIIALVGISDPLRPEVKNAVKACRDAGVIVRMVTGDYIGTAKSIAKECGILDESKGEIAIEGSEFAKMDKIQLLDILPRLRVMARSSPMDKYRLVSYLMEMGEVVAVTGDGSNDSPALKQADVGLSMGKCGTELAKMASDIVILDDNFNSIVSALKWGRCVYDNVRSFLQFQLTVNFASMFVAFFGSIILQETPLKTVQLLWFNLIMDSLGAIALATFPPTESLLKRKPYGRSDSLISNIIARNIIGQVIYQVIVLLVILFAYSKWFNLPVVSATDPNNFLSVIEAKETNQRLVSAVVFNTFVFMSIFNFLNSRLVSQDKGYFEGLFSNVYFISIFFGIIVIQVIIMLYGGRAFAIEKLSKKGWIISLSFGLSTIIIGFFIRLIHIEDRTQENLDKMRLERRVLLEKEYTGLSYQEQFRRRIDINGEIKLEK